VGIIVLPVIAVAILLGLVMWVAVVWLVLRFSLKFAACNRYPDRALVGKVALVTPLLIALFVVPVDYFAKMIFQLLRIPTALLPAVGVVYFCALFGGVVWYFVRQFLVRREKQASTTEIIRIHQP
jgi:hypothetical protein